MPLLDWDETDFIECLEVLPKVEEYETEYSFAVERNRVTLTVVVFPLESRIYLTLQETDTSAPLMVFSLLVFGKVLYIKEKQSEFLRLQDCVITPENFYYGLFDELSSPKFNVEIRSKPTISIRLLAPL